MSENQRDPQYKLRWPAELRDKISESARQNNRSMNAEILLRLENSFLFLKDPSENYRRMTNDKDMNIIQDLDQPPHLNSIHMLEIDVVRKIFEEIKKTQKDISEVAQELRKK